MKIEELRVGNCVLTSKDSHPIRFCSSFGLCNVEIEPDKFKPMPITDKWITKFGFEQVQSNEVYDSYDHPDLGVEIRVVAGIEGYLFIEECPDGFPFKSIHQLQNLCFAILGEELAPAKEIEL